VARACSFTPDLAPIVGEAPELKNYFVCAGMNSIGILTGGGMGRLVASRSACCNSGNTTANGSFP